MAKAKSQEDIDKLTAQYRELVESREQERKARLERAASRSERRADRQASKLFFGRRRAAKAAAQANGLREAVRRIEEDKAVPNDTLLEDAKPGGSTWQ